MKHDTEQVLGRLTPRGPAVDLRQQVLGAVDAELAVTASPRWTGRCALAVVATLLFAALLNVWVSRSADRRLAQLYGPRPVPRQIAEIVAAVESVTDAETGQWMQERLLAARASREVPPERAFERYQQIINQWVVIAKEWPDEKAQKGSKVDRDRSRRDRGDTSDYQRRAGFDHQFTA